MTIIRNVLMLAWPIVVLADIALVVTWLTMMTVDKMWFPWRFSMRTLLILMTIAAVHLGLIAVTFSVRSR